MSTPAGSLPVGSQRVLAVDAMSGDGGPAVVVEAVRLFHRRHPDVQILLVGDPEQIDQAAGVHSGGNPEPGWSGGLLRLVPAAQVVTMEDSAAVALRNKKQSSMRLAIDQVKNGQAAACVSAGNTGALLAISKFVLKTLPGIDRPAIISTIPAIDGHTHMLDLGANIDCTATQLYQFATMGSILAEAVDKIASPRVALLNIGSEELKGNEAVKQAAILLQQSPLNYTGFVEGNEIYTDKVDVVVCDGFVGNVSLKTSEGVARMVSHYLKEEFKRSWWNRAVALLALPILRSFGNRIDPRRYNGASLLGLRGVVVKSHGGADAVAFTNALEIALLEIALDVPGMITRRLEQTPSVA